MKKRKKRIHSIKTLLVGIIIGATLITAIGLETFSVRNTLANNELQKEQYGQRLLEDIQAQQQYEVELAWSVINQIYEKQVSGEYSEAQAKELAADMVRNLRFNDGKGYFWIDTVDGTNVVQLGDANVEGTNRYNDSDIDGNYYILGRESDLIIESNGENINPNLIEQKLNIKNIIDFSILGLNISSSETLSIVVQISKLTLQKHIKEILEEIENYNKTVSFTYQIKKIFFTYDEIKPKNAIKVSRKYLRKLFEENKIQTFTPSLIEQNVVTNEDVNAEIISNIKNIIAKELGIENKDILDDSNIIFDLNANSIEYISIICEINKEYKIDLKFDTEACFYTPKELAKRVVSLL